MNSLSPNLTIVAGRPVVSSLTVAAHFGKEHKNVLRDIRELLAHLPDELCALNFELTQIDVPMPGGGSRKDAVYNLSRDGFTLLAMGFRGKRALAWKIRYIQAFNAMEARLHERVTFPVVLPHPAESPLLILEGELARIRANVSFFKDMAGALNTLAFTRDADAFSKSMAGALRDIAQSCSDMLGRAAEDMGQVRGRTLAAVQTALAVSLGSPADAAARSAKAAKAARARWDKERDKKAATPKGRKGGTVH
jgi:Rha family phage regulatory protein